ncbi:MAG: hypothetical protein ACI957_003271, partial [Verrucomicrobiales bacterium]
LRFLIFFAGRESQESHRFPWNKIYGLKCL